jgi:NADH pyrophosphatase NudC (nudix superfamily)
MAGTKFRYCTECASPLTRRDATEYVCENGHEYWNELHGSVCVAVLPNGSVLLAARCSLNRGRAVRGRASDG